MVTVEQLRAAGFGPNAISRLADGGWLVRRHLGVYQVGVHGGPYGDEMAALLACGPAAALCRWASIAVFDLRERGDRPVDVIVPDGFQGHPHGVRRHQSEWLAPGDVVIRHGMPVTVQTVPREEERSRVRRSSCPGRQPRLQRS